MWKPQALPGFFHEIRPVSYRRIWNGFLVFCLAVFSMVWDRTPCHPVLNYLASIVGRVSLWVSNEHFTYYFFLADAYQHEWLRQEAVRKCGGFDDLERQFPAGAKYFFFWTSGILSIVTETKPFFLKKWMVILLRWLPTILILKAKS